MKPNLLYKKYKKKYKILKRIQSAGNYTITFTLWDNVLKRHVKPGTLMGIPINIVDYIGISNDNDYHAFIKYLGEIKLTLLTHLESLALGINAYNAFAIKTMIDNSCRYENQYDNTSTCLGPNFGLAGIRFIDNTKGSETITMAGWDVKLHTFGGNKYSLNEIEGMLLPKPIKPLFNKANGLKPDLRIHAAIVCDGISCPNLRREAYTPNKLDQQLSDAVTKWMANPWKGLRIDTSTNTVCWSRIMLWFKSEFDKQGGVIKVYQKYFSPEVRHFFKHNPKQNVKYFNYIWFANGPTPCTYLPSVMIEDPTKLDSSNKAIIKN